MREREREREKQLGATLQDQNVTFVGIGISKL